MRQRIFLLIALLMATVQGVWADKVTTDESYTVGDEHVLFTSVALIVIIICVAVVILAFIVKQALIVWRDGEIAYRANESSRQKSNELLDKYLDFLDKKNEQGVYDSDQYRETLARLVELSQKGQLSEITEDALNSIFKKADGTKAAK
jgi:type III secretory pathway component EscR